MSKPKRPRYETAAEVAKLIEAAPHAEWRAVIALARFAGLRIPWELRGLAWADVNWETRRMVVRSPKLEHATSGGVRVVPIFDDLLPHLEALFDRAPAGAELVSPRLAGRRSGNLRTSMRRFIERAGLVPWQRTFQNLRASFDIDLHERFPAHVAAAWAGHTEKTARGHYLAVRDGHFDRVASGGLLALQKALQQVPGPTCMGVNAADDLHGETGRCISEGATPVAPA